MKILYIDAVYGVRPDKLFSGLLELVNDKNFVIKEMQKTGSIFSLTEKNNGYFNQYSIKTSGPKRSTPLKQIFDLFKKGNFKKRIAKKLIMIYTKIGRAESKIHKTDFSGVHLHEIGSPGAILYAVGILACLDKIKATKIFRSRIGIGCGKIKCSHGILNIPAPCTKIITQNMGKCSLNIKGELTTPLGAAIISLISKPIRKSELKNLIIHKIALGWCDNVKFKINKPLVLYEGKYA